MIVYITNHAPSLWNEKGWSQGHCDVELSPRGHEMALRLGKREELKQIRAIITSDLKRSRQTASPLCRRLGISPIEDPMLREWRMPDYHKDPTYPPLPSPFDFETLEELRQRARFAMDNLVKRFAEFPLFVVTHTAFLRAFLETVDRSAAHEFRAIQTAVNTLTYDQGNWSVMRLNDRGPAAPVKDFQALETAVEQGYLDKGEME